MKKIFLKAISLFLCAVMLTLPGLALIRGDVNNDGELDSYDLVRLMKHLAGYSVDIYGADVNGDGFENALDIAGLMNLMANNIIEVIPENTRTEETRKMDMIAWYDIDHGSSSNDRPMKGWYYLYPETPGVAVSGGLYRSATPLLGTYDQINETTARQHLYWLSACGCNALTCDWTNYQSYNDPNADKSAVKYRKGVYNNTEVLLQTAEKLQSEVNYNIPLVYVTIRLNGDDYDMLHTVLDEVYELYSKYPDQIYHFDGNEKPFIVIFADKDVMQSWTNKGSEITDERFDIRWSNGDLAADFGTENSETGIYEVPADRKMWLFDDSLKSDEEGYYRTGVTLGEDGSAEMTTGWCAMWYGWSNDGSGWDGMDNTYDGLSCFERTTKDVEGIAPKALLVCRFNYPLVWKEEPQEGMGLYDSVHFEPCSELGFNIFNTVTERLYELNEWTGAAPSEPEIISVSEYSNTTLKLEISSEGYPLEYRVSKDGTFNDSVWKYLNVNDGVISPKNSDSGKVWIQTRNTFGVSKVIEVDLQAFSVE